MKQLTILCLLMAAVFLAPWTAESLGLEHGVSDTTGAVLDPDDGDFVVGLALSGGGAAGLAHIGVLKVFEEAGIPVDVVSGTSMGAIIGALYAIGYTPALIEQEIRNTDWRTLFEEPIYRRHLPMEEKRYDGRFLLTFPVENRRVELPTGLVSGNYIFNLLARLTWPYHDVDDFRKLPRPFVCMATDLETGEPVVMDSGFLPDAIRASMSIPSVFDPVWVNDKYLVDGGVLNNLPVDEAINLGADFVIAVNSSSDLRPADELRSLPDILTQTIAVGMRTSMLVQSKKADFFIQPDLRSYTTLSFGDVAAIIQAGEDAARARIDEIQTLADSLNNVRGPDREPIKAFQPADEIPVRSIRFEGLKTIPEDHIRTKLQFEENTTVGKEELNEGLLRLYGMKRFNKVSYRLSWDDDAADLTIHLDEQTANIIQTGIHHNNLTGPSLLFNASFRNLIFPASSGRVNFRVGHEFMFEGEYFNYIGMEPRLSFYGLAGFRERKFDIYEGDRRQASLRTDILYTEGLIGPLYASVVRAGFGYRLEHFNLTESTGDLEVPLNWNTMHNLVGEIEFDNLNRSSLPTRGQYVLARADLVPAFLPNDVSFGRISGEWRVYHPLSDKLTLYHKLRGGHIFGGTPPLHYRFYAGGDESFWGYPKDALAGNNLLTFRMAAQYRFYRNFFFTPGMNIGDRYQKLDLTVFDEAPRWGWAAILGWNTLIGPIEMILSASNNHAILYEFKIGLNF